MGDDPFHRYLLDSRGGWASASPRCYKYNDSTLDSLALKDDRISGVRRGYSARLFSGYSWGRWSEVVEGEDTAIVIRVQTTTGPCANE